ncbi:hypothetical protein EV193_10583 [Herbihabitans rhizosphaerae]|uniref:Uncharacterized protein n=1 Tax=Herbihabitans rhizosphaerae TaxID=1872711 RepID=A0A4Q7KLI9_9PSEU|nr:hypothetical protein [Herbihabitans rhizosphaerae]RZS37528.1 hypothetical protein EV193_10583 [Herbihabitans rhizosphaerae]
MPDPFLVAVAAALTGKAAASGASALGRLFKLVKNKLSGDQALTDETLPEQERTAQLASALETATTADPAFAESVRTLWREHEAEVHNEISGEVHGNVVQARDISGNISFGGSPH